MHLSELLLKIAILSMSFAGGFLLFIGTVRGFVEDEISKRRCREVAWTLMIGAAPLVIAHKIIQW